MTAPHHPPPWLVRAVMFLCVLTACAAIADTLCRVAGLDGCGWWVACATEPYTTPE